MRCRRVPPASFDVIYSSLAFHYAKDWDALLDKMHTVLRPGGIIIASSHHPDYWNKNPTGNSHTNDRGVTLTEHTAELPGGVKIVYYNHPSTASMCKSFSYAGFEVLHSFAPSVVKFDGAEKLRENYESLKNKNSQTPLFYIIKAKKC